MRSPEKSHNQRGPLSLTISPIKLSQAVTLVLLLALGWGLVKFARSSKAAAIPRARFSETVSVHASGRGNPSINLSDGRDVLTSYSGPAGLAQALQRNEAEPLALASADFDEDGVPDLICGYAHSSSGIITWLRGNVDSIYSNSPEAQRRKATGEFTDAPFLSPAFAFAVPAPAEFIGAGDFDADDHWDIVAAARGSHKLYLLSGDGRGQFASAKTIDLPGAVTAMATGDINRRDGLDDVIVAVNGRDGPKLMVFEGSEGALKARPELFDLPAEATAVALGQLDDDYPIDIAVAAGRELIVVHGRDRSEAVAELRHEPAPPATISRRSFPFAIKSLAIGDFTAGHAASIALISEDGVVHLLRTADVNAQASAQEKVTSWIELNGVSLPGPSGHDISESQCQILAAQVSSLPTDDLVVVDSVAGQMQIATGESMHPDAGSGFRREMTSLGVEGRPVAALPMRLNEDALSDLVILRSGNSAPTVVKTAAAATFIVTNTNDSGDGSLRKAIMDAADTISFNIPADDPNCNATTHVCTITPTSALPTITGAVTIDGNTQPGSMPNNLDDGDNARLMIQLNGRKSGDAAFGLTITGGRSVVRGLEIHSFSLGGVQLSGAGHNVIEGNFIGTDKNGTMPGGIQQPNGINTGIFGDDVIGSNNNLIGGTHPNGRNLISGNGHGIRIIGKRSTSNLVQGNYIGTDITGSGALGNVFEGVYIYDQPNNTIGGMKAGARNLISANGFTKRGKSPGLVITFKGATGNLVQGNYLGTNFDGTKAMGNASEGVLINLDAAANTIGGATARARNVISGNPHNGVVIGSEGLAPNNIVQGNFIGTDSSGTIALGNTNDGVIISKGGNPSIIKNNVISANGRNGVSVGGFFFDPDTGAQLFGGSGTVVKDNKIGTDPSGAQDLGNLGHGIYVENNSFIHTIKNNVIAFNKQNGICIPNKPGDDVTAKNTIPGFKVRISQNSIFSNVKAGIDLGKPGVTENHFKGPDSEANDAQNFPELSNVTNDGTNITIQGKLEKSTPGTTFTIEFFSNVSSPSSDWVRQGQHPLQNIQVTTDAKGTAIINVVLPMAMAGIFINATATDPAGNTSEFSDCFRGPELIEISVTSNLVAVGKGFISQVQVFILDHDDQGNERELKFSEDSNLKGDYKAVQKLVQNGNLKLPGGTSIISLADAVPPGKLVQIKFVNGDKDKTETIVPFKR